MNESQMADQILLDLDVQLRYAMVDALKQIRKGADDDALAVALNGAIRALDVALLASSSRAYSQLDKRNLRSLLQTINSLAILTR